MIAGRHHDLVRKQFAESCNVESLVDFVEGMPNLWVVERQIEKELFPDPHLLEQDSSASLAWRTEQLTVRLPPNLQEDAAQILHFEVQVEGLGLETVGLLVRAVAFQQGVEILVYC